MDLSYSGTGDLELFYDTYGNNGWLGLATIVPSNCVIQSATAQLNDSYLGNGSYSQTAVDHVACQEVGHTFGLDHNRSANDTCMNDQILSAGNQINQHDRDTLFCIYNTCNEPPNAILDWSNPYGLRVDFDASSSWHRPARPGGAEPPRQVASRGAGHPAADAAGRRALRHGGPPVTTAAGRDHPGRPLFVCDGGGNNPTPGA